MSIRKQLEETLKVKISERLLIEGGIYRRVWLNPSVYPSNILFDDEFESPPENLKIVYPEFSYRIIEFADYEIDLLVSKISTKIEDYFIRYFMNNNCSRVSFVDYGFSVSTCFRIVEIDYKCSIISW